MAHRAVRGTPYQLTHVYTAWAVHRYGYLRGRLLLAGIEINDLDAGRLIDVVEAIFLEPALHGGIGVDNIIDKVRNALIELMPDRETHGLTEAAREGARAAEAAGFGQARPRE